MSLVEVSLVEVRNELVDRLAKLEGLRVYSVPPEAAQSALACLRTLEAAPTTRSLACHLATRAAVGASVDVGTSTGHSA